MRYAEPEIVRIGLPKPRGQGPFQDAMIHAQEEAGRRSASSMLLSWKDLRTGARAPDVEACNDCGLEGWELYALSRGAELRVEVGGDYVFYFKLL